MVTTRYLEDLHVALHIGTGEIDLAELVVVATRWRVHDRFHPDTPVVYDLAGASELKLDWDDIKSTAPEVADELEGTRSSTARTAWVVSDVMAEILIESVGLAFPWTTEWRVFDQPEDAIEWVIRRS